MGVDDTEAVRPYSVPVPLTADHNTNKFDCGKAKLTDWLKGHALTNEGRSSRTYVVLINNELSKNEVVAYYTLATGGVTRTETPRKIRHGLPNPVPVMILGRLAVDQRHQSKGLGPALLKEAMQRTLEVSQSAGVRALIIHAIDDEAVKFYTKFDFIVFPTDSRTMFLPIETLAAALS